MEHERIQRDITCIKRGIVTVEDNLVIRRKLLAHAEAQLVEATKRKRPELVNGDYGKFSISKWVFVDGKVNWEDSGIDKNHFEGILGDSRKGNIFREMEE